MKTKDIVRNYGIDKSSFESWLKASGYAYKVGGLGGIVVDDGLNVSEMVSSFKQYYAEQQDRLARERSGAERAAQAKEAEAEQAAQQKRQALANILITSGFTFDGYSVSKYSGYISGDDVISVPRGSQGFFGDGVTDVGASLMASMVIMRRNALAELKEAAYTLGCNAVIGVDFDYLTLDPETVTSSGGTLYLPYVFGVTANGNAVAIERNRSHETLVSGVQHGSKATSLTDAVAQRPPPPRLSTS